MGGEHLVESSGSQSCKGEWRGQRSGRGGRSRVIADANAMVAAEQKGLLGGKLLDVEEGGAGNAESERQTAWGSGGWQGEERNGSWTRRFIDWRGS